MSNAAPLTAPAGMERAKAPFAFADLWALVLRYAFNTMGPISIAGAHFLASLLFLRFLPPAQFGLFSFVFVVVPFALSMGGALFGAALVNSANGTTMKAKEKRPNCACGKKRRKISAEKKCAPAIDTGPIVLKA